MTGPNNGIENKKAKQSERRLMKELPNILSVFFGIVVVMLTLVLFLEFQDNRELRKENTQLKSDVDSIKGELRALTELKSELNEKIDTGAARINELKEALDKKSESASQTDEADRLEKPYQAQVFLGNDYVGSAWIVHARTQRKGEDGNTESAYTPVVRLDPALKNRLQTTVTNVQELPVYRQTTINSTPYQFNNYAWWAWPDGSIRRHSRSAFRSHPASAAPDASSETSSVTLKLDGVSPWTPAVAVTPGPPSGGFSGNATSFRSTRMPGQSAFSSGAALPAFQPPSGQIRSQNLSTPGQPFRSYIR